MNPSSSCGLPASSATMPGQVAVAGGERQPGPPRRVNFVLVRRDYAGARAVVGVRRAGGWSHLRDLNPEPPLYESGALPLS